MLTREQKEAHQRIVQGARERDAIRTHQQREPSQGERAVDERIRRAAQNSANARWSKSRGDA